MNTSIFQRFYFSCYNSSRLFYSAPFFWTLPRPVSASIFRCGSSLTFDDIYTDADIYNTQYIQQQRRQSKMHMYIYLHVWLLLLLRFSPVWPMNIGEQHLHNIHWYYSILLFWPCYILYRSREATPAEAQCTHTYMSSRCGWDPVSFHLNINLYPRR